MSTQATTDPYIDLPGARLRWRRAGSGPALVLLHGWALDLDAWEPLATLLAPRFEVLRFDRRGFGLSSGAPDIHRNVPDLLAVMDAARIERAVLVGMSQGARLAMHFALAHPGRVRALVLDGAPAVEAESELPMAQYQRELRNGLPALRSAILAHPLMRLAQDAPATQALLAAMLDRYRGLDLLAPQSHADAPDLRELKAPVLILNGAEDSPARLAAGRQLQAAIAGARRVELPDAGHLAALDQPEAYAHCLAGFCDSLER
jgi:pimeloyl-ACP methyl ester carboxylesterase